MLTFLISSRLKPFLALALLMVAATCYAEESTYATRAREVMDAIQTTYWDPARGLYAQTPENREPDFMWGNGVMFSALVGATRHQPEQFGPVMKQFFGAMEGYWDARATPPGYEPAPGDIGKGDKYYDDNAWMVITFTEAYALTGEEPYLRRAREALDFVLSGWDNVGGGGIWWHEKHKGNSKNTCANAPGAVGCLAVARYSDAPIAAKLTTRARQITDWTVANLQAPDALFWDAKNMENGEVNRMRLTYNSGLMMRAFLGLYQAGGNSQDLTEAGRVAKATGFFEGYQPGVYRNPVKFTHLLVEADLALYRTTKEESLLQRAKQNADFLYERWKANHPRDLISNASIARTLWLLADTETEVGRNFWQKVEKPAERQ